MASRLLRALCAIAGSLIVASAHPSQSADGVVLAIDFSGFAGGSVLDWLGSKGFLPKRDAIDAEKVVYSVLQNGLVQETKTRAFGVLVNETDVRDYSRVRIEWGIDAFPSGASYDDGVRSEAIMVYIFFGKEKVASGSLLVPDSPYFIGLFLCESGSTNLPFMGRYHRASGRFICVDRPPLGKTVTTTFPIAAEFTRIFGLAKAPDISGFAISIDTDNVKGTGIAKSLIRRIEFLR